MKHFFILLLFVSSDAWSVPMIDSAKGTTIARSITVLSDDKDPNLFYYFPNHYGLGTDQKNRKLFSYIERATGWFSKPVAQVSTVYEAYFSEDLNLKIAEIKKEHPNAKFTPIPYTNARIVPNRIYNFMLSKVVCQETGNHIGQQIACVWEIAPPFQRVFRQAARSASVVQVLEYSYSFAATQNGKPLEFRHSVPIYFSDLMTGRYFLDSQGNPIQD